MEVLVYLDKVHMLRIKCNDGGEVVVDDEVKRRWNLFDNRFEGLYEVSEEQRSVIEVPFPLYIVAGWLQIDRYCKLIEEGVSFAYTKLNASLYSPVCRFMDSTDGVFWLFLTIGDAPDAERRELHLAISNTMKKLGIARQFERVDGDVYRYIAYEEIPELDLALRGVQCNEEKDSFTSAVSYTHPISHDDDYLFGSSKLYASRQEMPDFVARIIAILPRPITMEKRMEALRMIKVMRTLATTA